MDKNNFCILPFVHFHANNFGNVTPCCVNPKVLGNLGTETIEEIWENKSLVDIREKMIKGVKEESCSVCYQKEKCGTTSLRQLSNYEYSDLDIQNVISSPKIIYFDIRFSNLCNLKCRTCWHGSSSSWYEDSKKLNSAAGEKALIKIEGRDDVLSQISEHIPHVREFYFAGGEPLIMKEHYDILRLLIDKGNTSVRLRYNTNFTKLKYKGYDLFDLWKNFKKIDFNISIDAVNEKTGYVRKGEGFATLEKNREILRENAPYANVMVSITVSIFNIFTLTEIIDRLSKTKFVESEKFHFNILETPSIYSIQILPKSKKKIIKKQINEYISSNRLSLSVTRDLQDVISYMNSRDLSYKLSEFCNATVKLDSIRDESYKDIYKDQENFIDLFNEKKYRNYYFLRKKKAQLLNKLCDFFAKFRLSGLTRQARVD